MILHVESDAVDGLAPVKESLEELAGSWGYQLHEIPAKTPNASDPVRESEKSVDPVAVAALILSIPSAALAVTDLADRIHKRRRAKNLIDKVNQITDDRTTIKVLTQDGPRDLLALSPDQLLDLSKSGDSTA